jgi:hypothetical protein
LTESSAVCSAGAAFTVRKTSRNAFPPPAEGVAATLFGATVPFDGRIAMAVGKTGSPATRIFLQRQTQGSGQD